MWKAALHPERPTTVIEVDLKRDYIISMVRLWNYWTGKNSWRFGARHLTIEVDHQPVFCGELPACTGPRLSNSRYEQVLFTDSEDIFKELTRLDWLVPFIEKEEHAIDELALKELKTGGVSVRLDPSVSARDRADLSNHKSSARKYRQLTQEHPRVRKAAETTAQHTRSPGRVFPAREEATEGLSEAALHPRRPQRHRADKAQGTGQGLQRNPLLPQAGRRRGRRALRAEKQGAVAGQLRGGEDAQLRAVPAQSLDPRAELSVHQRHQPDSLAPLHQVARNNRGRQEVPPRRRYPRLTKTSSERSQPPSRPTPS